MINIREQTRRKLWKSDRENIGMRLSGRTRATSDIDSMRVNYVGIDGTITLAELIEWAKSYPIEFDNLHLNWATIRWYENPTPEDIEADKREAARVAENRRQWEMKTLAELKAKYEKP